MESNYEFHFRRYQEETVAADQSNDAAVESIHLDLPQLHVAAAEKIVRSRSANSRSKGGRPANKCA